jgi:hypothetical protein
MHLRPEMTDRRCWARVLRSCGARSVRLDPPFGQPVGSLGGCSPRRGRRRHGGPSDSERELSGPCKLAGNDGPEGAGWVVGEGDEGLAAFSGGELGQVAPESVGVGGVCRSGGGSGG